MTQKHVAHHYKVRPKDHRIEEAELRFRAAHQAKLDEPRCSDKRLAELEHEEHAAHEALRLAHAQPDTFICDNRECAGEFPLSELVLIPFLRVIRQGQWYYDDGQEKYLRLCVGCDERLGLVKYPA